MKNIDDKLIQLYKEINRREKLKIHLDHLEQVISTKQVEKDNLLQILAKEEKDVIDLEKESLYNLFSRILGTREKQLEKERQEYLHALMLFRASQSTLNALVQEKDILYKSLRGTQNSEKEYQRLMTKKEKLLLEAEGFPLELVRLNERIATFNEQILEIERAVKKGNSAKKKLIKIIHNLKRIEKWGFQGRNSSSSSMLGKTRQIQNDIYSTNNLLQVYEDKLYDISGYFSSDFDRQIKHFEAFIDRFVDSLITDWVVNNLIQNSIHFINIMIDSITKLNGTLEYEQTKIQIYIEEDSRVKQQLILDNINKNKS